MVLFLILFIYDYNCMVLSLSNTFSKFIKLRRSCQKISDLGLMKTLYIFYNLMLNRPFDAMFCVYLLCSEVFIIYSLLSRGVRGVGGGGITLRNKTYLKISCLISYPCVTNLCRESPEVGIKKICI